MLVTQRRIIPDQPNEAIFDVGLYSPPQDYNEHKPIYTPPTYRNHRSIRSFIYVTLVILILGFLTEYWSEYSERCAHREAARAKQIPHECLTTPDKQREAATMAGYIAMAIRSSSRASTHERCQKFYEEYYAALLKSVYPNPILVFTRMLTTIVISPFIVTFQTVSDAASSVLEALPFLDKLWVLTGVILLPVLLLYVYVNRRRHVPFREMLLPYTAALLSKERIAAANPFAYSSLETGTRMLPTAASIDEL